MMIVARYLVLAHVPSVNDFDSIILLFFDNKLDTGVLDKNRVTLSKSQTKCTRERNQMTRNGRHSQVVQNRLDNSGMTHLTS
jgi:hypothetical protein